MPEGGASEGDVRLIFRDLEYIKGDIDGMKETHVKDVAELKAQLEKAIGEIKALLVTKDQFWPVKTLVYGFVGIVLTAFVEALVVLVIAAKVSA